MESFFSTVKIELADRFASLSEAKMELFDYIEVFYPPAERSGERVRQMKRGATWKHVVVGICLVVGLLHFVAGPGYGGPWPGFVRGYLIDILLPFALYLLLGVSWRVLADSRLARGLVVLAVGGTVEGLQYLGLPLFGATFDPLDLVMYALGVSGGVVLELLVAPRFSGPGGVPVSRNARQPSN